MDEQQAQAPEDKQPIIVQQQVVMGDQRKKVHHLLHFFLTIITFGLWLPVWIFLAIKNS